MSTRGVQLKDVTPLDRDSSGDSSNTQVQTVQGGDTGNSKSGNWSINIGDITFPNAQMGSERDVNPDPDTRVWKQSQITYTDGLKAGDMVLVQKLNDNNKYVIIARVVEA